MARVTMLDMHRDGLIILPPKQGRQNRPKPIVFGPDTEAPLFPAPTSLDEVRPLTLRLVVRGTREGKLWNEFIARYHYLGYRTLVGAQMRYAVHDRDGWPVAMLGFSTAAWKLAPRDTFIGWTLQLREKNLPLVVDNPEVPHPALDHDPQPGLAHPRHRPPPTARRLDRALQHHARADRNLRRDPALHRRGLQGLRLAPCRNHPGTRALRPGQTLRQAPEGHLATPAQKRLETNPQPLKSTDPYRLDRTITKKAQFTNCMHGV